MSGARTIKRSDIEAAKARARAARDRVRVIEARICPIAFCEYVGRDKETGLPIKMQPYHKAYIKALLLPLWDRLPELTQDRLANGVQFLPTSDADLVTIGHPQSGKTEIALLVATWLMSHMAMRGTWPWCWWAGDTKSIALKRAREMVSVFRGEGECGKAFRMIFPDIGIHRGGDMDGWWMSCNGKPASGRDPSVFAAGRDTGVHGGRFHIGIFDDVQNNDNQRLPGSRDRVYNQFVQKVVDRRSRASMCWFLTNAWYEDSADARLVEAGWREYLLTVRDKNGKLNFPDLWPEERIERESKGPQASIPGEVERRFQCKRLPRGASSRFDIDHIKACYKRGRGFRPALTAEDIPDGAHVYTGVDIGGITGKKASDASCFFTVMVLKDTTRVVINIESGHWKKVDFSETANRIHEQYHLTRNADGRVTHRHGKFIVENNAMQEYIAQDMATDNLPVEPFTTGKNKHSAEVGIDVMAGEFALRMWEIPVSDSGNLHPEVLRWQSAMVGYSPDTHTGDSLMASWFARMGAIDDHDYGAMNLSHQSDAAVKRVNDTMAALDEGGEAAQKASLALFWDEMKESVGHDVFDLGNDEGVESDDGYGVM